jgi:intein/homing endonuclease
VSCFDENTIVLRQAADQIGVITQSGLEEVRVSDVKRGDLVATLVNGSVSLTKVVALIPFSSSQEYDYVHLRSSGGRELKVTSGHGVIVIRDVGLEGAAAGERGRSEQRSSRRKGNTTEVLVKAKSVKVGDLVKVSSGEVEEVTSVELHVGRGKVTLSTETGSVLANGVFVSTICADTYEDGDAFESVSRPRSSDDWY